MVNQHAKKLGLKFKARVQMELYTEMFQRRLSGEKLYINPAMEEAFLKDALSPAEKKIGKLIKEWHEIKLEESEKELFKQKKRQADAERALLTKITKKAQEDKRISTDKIEKLLREIKKHQKLEAKHESDSRIFPMHYVSMLTVDEKGDRVIMPIRYHMRPSNKDESFDREYFGCYNARFDNLTRVEFWRNALGKRHGIIVVNKFYENVDPKAYAKKNKLSSEMKKDKNLVVCFEPDDGKPMLIPVLWDVWKKRGSPTLYSGALITDEPRPEVAAAGHDRTPIFLKASAVDSWLSAKGEAKAIKEILQERETPYYNHNVLGVAS